jgi:hypothetical protein
MIVLKATQAQYEALNGHTYKVSKLEFVKDANNNWIVGKEVIHNGNFLDIRSQLLELEEIEYIPVEVTE